MKTRALYRCCAVVQVKSWLSFLGVYRSSANIRGVVVCQWNSPVPLALAHQSGEGALIRVPSLLTNTPCIHKGFLGVKIVVRERDLDRVDTYEGPSFEMPKNKSSKKGKGECSCSPRGSFCTFISSLSASHIVLWQWFLYKEVLSNPRILRAFVFVLRDDYFDHVQRTWLKAPIQWQSSHGRYCNNNNTRNRVA